MRLSRRSPRGTGAAWVGLYPRSWRTRYGAEMLAVLDDRALDWPTRFDLLRGALDAHVHPLEPPPVPRLTAVVAGVVWLVAGAMTMAEPVPPDWPGFLVWTLPLGLIGAIAGLLVVLAIGRRAGVTGGRRSDVALGLAIVGHLAWVVALAVAVGGGPYGAITAASQSIAAIGSVAVGLDRWRAADRPIAEALMVLGTALLVPSPAAWFVVAGGWFVLALVAVRERSDPGRHRVVLG